MGAYPTLTIQEKFKPVITDYQFDKERYGNFLHDNGISDKDIAELSLIVGESKDYPANGRVVGSYMAVGEKELGTTTHTIVMIPNCDYTAKTEQGNTLRHETQHYFNNRAAFAHAGKLFLPETRELIQSGRLGMLAQLPPDLIALSWAGLEIASTSTMLMVLAKSIKYHHIDNERTARKAEVALRESLPDGTLFVEYDVEKLAKL